MKKGNTKLVESSSLNIIFPCQHLKEQSLHKGISRHFVNMALVMPQNTYALFNWIVFMSDSKSVITYSAKLLNQFDTAVKRYKSMTKFKNGGLASSRDTTRISFIYLIEYGYLIRLTNNKFMINPMVVVVPLTRLGKIKLQKDYISILDGENVSDNLTKWCNKLAK